MFHRVSFSCVREDWSKPCARSLEQERALRRPFLWLIVAAGAGVVLYFSAEREPSLALCLCALAAFVSSPRLRAAMRVRMRCF